MIPIERAHYNVWAERLESELQAAYPRVLWLVLQHDELTGGDPWRMDIPRDGAPLPLFRLMAVKLGTGRFLWEDVPFTLVVDEESFVLVVARLGRELERRLAAMVGEGDISGV